MPSDTKTYDLIVIGGGPAGLTAASGAAELHKKVAIINQAPELGGAGINTGTVPSKTLRETALALSGLKSRNLYGVDLSLRREVKVTDFLKHEQGVKAGFHTILSDRLKSQNADVYFGTGMFVEAHTIKIELHEPENGDKEIILKGESILIATGSSPVRPPLFSFGTGEIYDSDTILNLDRIPKRLAVIGSGVIGSEYGCTFAALGAEVHIIDGRNVLLPFLDSEISHELGKAMERNGVVFHWNQKVEDCKIAESSEITLKLASGEELKVDAVLVAAGRKSNIEHLNLESAGVATGERGLVTVDENYRTNIPHIYAAGDVIGFPALASTSMEQGRRVARHAFGLEAVNLSPLLPNGVYTVPEVSMVGETEETLKKKGIDYVVGKAPYRNNARGQIIGDVDGFLKLLFNRDDMKLLGVHVMGEIATEVVHIGLMAMLTGCTATIFVEACFNVPTLGMLYKTAALSALNSASKPS